MRTIPGTKYISSFTSNGKQYYLVQKRVNGETKGFGFGNTLIEALMVRDWCEANNWKKRYSRPSLTGERYIRKLHGRYCIQKWVNGKCEHFGSFKSLEDAIKERDLLIKYDWDLELLCECLNEGDSWSLKGITSSWTKHKQRNDIFSMRRKGTI